VRAGDPERPPLSPEIAGFVLLAVFLFAIFVGFPVAFTLIFLSLAFGYFALGDMVFYLTVLQTIGLMKEEVLAAVPLFIFMGYLLEEGGLMERLFRAFHLLLVRCPARSTSRCSSPPPSSASPPEPSARRWRSSASWRCRPW
jgi:TRAP-type mannitol/chloroaromatic compound transport system permease large subunit